jgi:ABC-type Fe3+-citrate transport system substrate-binding protein
MSKYNEGIPEIVAKVADSTDNESVKEKWEELKTLVHLVHKDEIMRQRKKLEDWKQGMNEVNKKISTLQQSSWGVGVEEDENDFNVTYHGGGLTMSPSYDMTTFDCGDALDSLDEQMELNFPMTEEEEYANAGVSIEELANSHGYSEEHIRQMQDPSHNQWGAAGEPKKK